VNEPYGFYASVSMLFHHKLFNVLILHFSIISTTNMATDRKAVQKAALEFVVQSLQIYLLYCTRQILERLNYKT